jgi:antitoxin component YwqK of YwqJK toxin-antitoxin module
MIEKKDSGWLRRDYFLGTKSLQMEAMFSDSMATVHHGKATFFYADGRLQEMGNYVFGKREGIYLNYYRNGIMQDSAFFKNGKLVGFQLGWHYNGMLRDSLQVLNDSVHVRVSWFDNGNLANTGHYLHEKEHGTWNFYHDNGELAAKEKYNKGKLLDVSFFDEQGNPQSRGKIDSLPARHKQGDMAWLNQLDKEQKWPDRYNVMQGTSAIVVAEALLDTNGNLIYAAIDVPFHPEFDAEVLKVFQNWEPWIPARAHNRRVMFKIILTTPFGFEK